MYRTPATPLAADTIEAAVARVRWYGWRGVAIHELAADVGVPTADAAAVGGLRTALTVCGYAEEVDLGDAPVLRYRRPWWGRLACALGHHTNYVYADDGTLCNDCGTQCREYDW